MIRWSGAWGSSSVAYPPPTLACAPTNLLDVRDVPRRGDDRLRILRMPNAPKSRREIASMFVDSERVVSAQDVQHKKSSKIAHASGGLATYCCPCGPHRRATVAGLGLVGGTVRSSQDADLLISLPQPMSTVALRLL